MKFSIIIPSYNQGCFIEKTLNSIFTQEGDFSIETLVFDAKSKDSTVKILNDFEKRIKNKEFANYNKGVSFQWISESDKGQTDAINKGLAKATGDILAYINSDDSYCRGAFDLVSKAFKEKNANWVTGYCNIIDSDDKKIRKSIEKYKTFWLKHYSSTNLKILNFISQPATFWSKEVASRIGLFDVKLKYTMDYDYWLRISEKNKLFVVNKYLANFRVHSQSKGETAFIKQFREDFETLEKNCNNKFLRALHWLNNFCIILAYRYLK